MNYIALKTIRRNGAELSAYETFQAEEEQVAELLGQGAIQLVDQDTAQLAKDHVRARSQLVRQAQARIDRRTSTIELGSSPNDGQRLLTGQPWRYS